MQTKYDSVSDFASLSEIVSNLNGVFYTDKSWHSQIKNQIPKIWTPTISKILKFVFHRLLSMVLFRTHVYTNKHHTIKELLPLKSAN